MTRIEMIDILEQGSKIIRKNNPKDVEKKLKAIHYYKADRKRWRHFLRRHMAYLKRNKEPFKYLLESVGLKFNAEEELVNI